MFGNGRNGVKRHANGSTHWLAAALVVGQNSHVQRVPSTSSSCAKSIDMTSRTSQTTHCLPGRVKRPHDQARKTLPKRSCSALRSPERRANDLLRNCCRGGGG